MTDFFQHPTALVESQAIGPGTRIWAFAHVMQGASIGANCNICDRVYVEGGAVIGDDVTLKNNVCVWDGVTIESGVFVGPSVSFTNDCRPRSPRSSHAGQRYALRENWMSETVLREGCSIGANATILPGLEIGAFAFVAAGSVVTRDVKAFALVMGNPARRVGWVCHCGARLPDIYSSAHCTACGERRRLSVRTY